MPKGLALPIFLYVLDKTGPGCVLEFCKVILSNHNRKIHLLAFIDCEKKEKTNHFKMSKLCSNLKTHNPAEGTICCS